MSAPVPPSEEDVRTWAVGVDGATLDEFDALCAHLAWWTGKDCERMARLLRASGLARDKHDREDYLQRTILRACGLVEGVLQDTPAVQLPAPRPPAPPALAREALPEIDVARLIEIERQLVLEHFEAVRAGDYRAIPMVGESGEHQWHRLKA